MTGLAHTVKYALPQKIFFYLIMEKISQVVSNKQTTITNASINCNSQITDDQLIKYWLHNKALRTQECYRSMIKNFFNYVNKPLKAVTLEDIHNFLRYLKECRYKPISIADYTIPIKSLFTYAHQLGAVKCNIGAVLKKPKFKNQIAERILLPEEIHRMIFLEPILRNKLILKVLYAGGLRATELSRLKWRDVQETSDGCVQLAVFGKGDKTRYVKLPPNLSSQLRSFRGNLKEDSAVFRSKARTNGRHLYRQSIGEIVRAAGQRAGIEKKVSPHFLRHSHASHALEKGAPINLVQETLGHASIKTTELYLHVQPGESSGNYLRMFN